MPKYQIPTLDFEAVAAMDDDARAAALAAYRTEVAALGDALAADEAVDAEKENAPAAARYDAAKYKMASDKSLVGFADAMDEIEAVLAETPALAGMQDEERLRTAYYIVRGKHGAAAPAPTPTAAAQSALKVAAPPAQEPSAEELFAALEKNPAAMRLCEARLLELLGADEAPALFATAGNATAPATPKEKPKTIDEASGLARAAFGV